MTDYTLTHGSHETAADGTCLMEAVAWLAGEPHSDRPACACPVLSEFGRRINDAMGKGPKGDELRARYLADLAPRLVGTRSTPEIGRRRAYVLADHAVRALAPMALDAAALVNQAQALRDLGAIEDVDTADAAACAAYATASAACAANAAYAAYAAAYAAANAAAYAAANAANAANAAYADAAYAAANAAADAAANAACAATRAAARVANPDAVWAAARDAFVAAIEVGP